MGHFFSAFINLSTLLVTHQLKEEEAPVNKEQSGQGGTQHSLQEAPRILFQMDS